MYFTNDKGVLVKRIDETNILIVKYTSITIFRDTAEAIDEAISKLEKISKTKFLQGARASLRQIKNQIK